MAHPPWARPTAIGQRFLDWYAHGPKDVGISTAAVLRAAGGDPARLPDAAAAYFDRYPRGAAGNGSLMRTAPVALVHLGHDTAIARAAWWRARLDEAEARDPHTFSSGNGFVVTALQAAHAVITRTPVPDRQPCRHLQDALVAAVRVGNDTDTVAAIAGQVLGARWGASAVPWTWRRHLHGWPGYGYGDLVRLAVLAANGGLAGSGGWPAAPSMLAWGRRQEPTPVCVPGPDEGVLLGNLPGLALALEQGIDAVVSLCRVGTEDVPSDVEHVQVWIADQQAPGNPNLDFVLADAVDALRVLRDEGRRVYLHCVGGRSRTPTVAAVLPEVRPNPTFRQALDRWDGTHFAGVSSR